MNVVCKEWLALLQWPGTMGVCENQATCWVHTLPVNFPSLGEKAVTLEMRSSNELMSLNMHIYLDLIVSGKFRVSSPFAKHLFF